MSALIFENHKRLAAKDIYLQILIGLGILFLVGVLSPLRNHGQPFSWTSKSFLLLGGALLMIWTLKALGESTLKAVKIAPENENLIFVINRQLRNDLVVTFNLKEVQLNIKDVPSRSLPRKKVLTVNDNRNRLDISSRQKGLSETILKEIVEKLKHYPQQKL